jgi:hypothetical protein
MKWALAFACLPIAGTAGAEYFKRLSYPPGRSPRWVRILQVAMLATVIPIFVTVLVLDSIDGSTG